MPRSATCSHYGSGTHRRRHRTMDKRRSDVSLPNEGAIQVALSGIPICLARALTAPFTRYSTNAAMARLLDTLLGRSVLVPAPRSPVP